MDNLTETKLTSEKIYSGCILDFYRDTVRLPNGGHRAARAVAPRGCGVASCRCWTTAA